jgi:hypothetical protein
MPLPGCPALAPLRHADGPCECLLIGADRKWPAEAQDGAFDPERTFVKRTHPLPTICTTRTVADAGARNSND